LAPTAGALLLDKAGSNWTYVALMMLAVINVLLGVCLWSAKNRK
jgi:hypothetical protein